MFELEQPSQQHTITPLNQEHIGPVDQVKATTRRDVQLERVDGHDASASNCYDIRTTTPAFIPTSNGSERKGAMFVFSH
ncbi:unnamed protein product [Toxocara canis]|uniref:Uncharacterized protein n=1 Tax=Toxocara canis TaxID=6265 RepID=A0A183UUV4_TOXCA|nr:unnamed protein product [Toxocara canis]